MAIRSYHAKHLIHNKGEFRGVEAYAEVWVEDQHYIVHASDTLYRKDYKTNREFLKAIDNAERALKNRRLA